MVDISVSMDTPDTAATLADRRPGSTAPVRAAWHCRRWRRSARSPPSTAKADSDDGDANRADRVPEIPRPLTEGGAVPLWPTVPNVWFSTRAIRLPSLAWPLAVPVVPSRTSVGLAATAGFTWIRFASPT